MTTTFAVVAILVIGGWAQPASRERLAFGTCMKLGEQIVGEQPVKAGGKVALKKVLHVAPRFPDLPPGTRVGLEPWVGEVLIDPTGKAARVWQLRGFRLTPDFAAFNQSVIDSIQQWQFEPFVIHEHATPVCMSVTTMINLQ